MPQPLESAALDQIFLQARTYGTTAESWLPQPVSDAHPHLAHAALPLPCSEAIRLFNKLMATADFSDAFSAMFVSRSRRPPRRTVSARPAQQWGRLLHNFSVTHS